VPIACSKAVSHLIRLSHKGMQKKVDAESFCSRVLSVPRTDRAGNGPEGRGPVRGDWHRRAGRHHLCAILDPTSPVIGWGVLAAGRFKEW